MSINLALLSRYKSTLADEWAFQNAGQTKATDCRFRLVVFFLHWYGFCVQPWIARVRAAISKLCFLDQWSFKEVSQINRGLSGSYILVAVQRSQDPPSTSARAWEWMVFQFKIDGQCHLAFPDRWRDLKWNSGLHNVESQSQAGKLCIKAYFPHILRVT